MDFINARRFLENEYQEYLKDPEGYCGKPDETVQEDSAPEDLCWGSAPDPGV